MSRMSKNPPTLMLNSLAATAAAVALVGLSGCAPQDEVTVDVYDTAATCVAKSGDPVACEKNDKIAREVHAKTAPRYADRIDCEEDWGDGKCEAAPPSASTALNSSGQNHTHGGGVMFWPYYYGYMVGSSSSSGVSLAPQPVYRSRDGQDLTASGTAVVSGSRYSASSLAAPGQPVQYGKGSSGTKNAAVAGVSRGGFGTAGRAGSASVGG